MKRISILTILLCCIISFVSAKEYRFDEEHISVNIPDNFIVATVDDIPDAFSDYLELPKEQIRKDLLYEQKAILYGLNIENYIAIWIVIDETKAAKAIGDALNVNIKPEELRGELTEAFRVKHNGAKLTDIYDYKTPNAHYIVCDAIKKNDDLGQIVFKSYLTAKNGKSVGFNGMCYSNKSTLFSGMMSSIVNSVRYDVGISAKKSASKTQISSQPPRFSDNGGLFAQSLYRGATKGLAAFTILIILGFSKYVWDKFKKFKNNYCNEDKTIGVNEENTQNTSSDQINSYMDKIKNAVNSVSASKNENVPEEIMKYKKLLDAGAITQAEYDAKKKQLLKM